jgi:hypothetical protein
MRTEGAVEDDAADDEDEADELADDNDVEVEEEEACLLSGGVGSARN